MTTTDTPRLISDVRGVRYGEVIAAFLRDGWFEAEVFGTQFLNDCPQDLWDGLDAVAIAEEMGAVAVKLNGPRYWTLDGMGTGERPGAGTARVQRDRHAPVGGDRPGRLAGHGPVHGRARRPRCRVLLRCR